MQIEIAIAGSGLTLLRLLRYERYAFTAYYRDFLH